MFVGWSGCSVITDCHQIQNSSSTSAKSMIVLLSGNEMMAMEVRWIFSEVMDLPERDDILLSPSCPYYLQKIMCFISVRSNCLGVVHCKAFIRCKPCCFLVFVFDPTNELWIKTHNKYPSYPGWSIAHRNSWRHPRPIKIKINFAIRQIAFVPCASQDTFLSEYW